MAKDWDPLAIDFAAIRTLRLVSELGSFSKAAEVLGTNQSTISYTMDRLRAAFHDKLFVRQHGGIAPTPRCVEIVECASRLLEGFEGLMRPTDFDPASASGQITIACNYYERSIILPRTIAEIRRRAPRLLLEIKTARAKGMAYLKRGEADLLIGPYEVQEENFYHRHLLDDHYVCVMHKGHLFAGRKLRVDDYVKTNHAVVTYGGTWRSGYLRRLDERGLSLNQVVTVPSISDLTHILPGTDLVSTVPSRIGSNIAKSVVATPCPFPEPFQIGMTWTSRTHHSAAHQWLRQLMARIAGTLPYKTAPTAPSGRSRGNVNARV
ncbi:LysR family transcriptional regulator [Bradyrhizobium sp. CIAT3101]|uniref:LysR family transcriptional regulator n=1 Tax=Bradyrhizobium sp. CIAT3101 TaxID=439387 RepID=UPI0024B137CB|nr:LysR family transcriptional regulator [Bradyrhizobium sp. CIAT3101]WFU80631.1 LysR family transcriptional regulator [Bradyrhizobium sp. CIAT3101]